MKTLKQIFEEGCCDYCACMGTSDAFECWKRVTKEWLQIIHKEFLDKIWYEEMYVQEVIPQLLEELEQK